jgi:hypothetical protein
VFIKSQVTGFVVDEHHSFALLAERLPGQKPSMIAAESPKSI